MSEVSTIFSVNQKIVYPSQGVGEIREITEKIFHDTTILYYVIYLPVSDMVVMVPVDKAEDIGIRSIVEPEEARRAIELISEAYEPIPSDWKLRYQINLDLLKKGSVNDIATIVRSLYHRSKVKELPIQERKLYDSAKKLLEDEVSFSLGISREEVEGMIHERLEPPREESEEKEIIADEDDDDFILDDVADDTSEEENDDDLDDSSSDE